MASLTDLSVRASALRSGLRRLVEDMATLRGPLSKLRLARMRIERLVLGELEEPGQETVVLRIGKLGGQALLVRPRTSDIDLLDYAFRREHHLPPPELAGRVRRIVEFGTNIGMMLADLAYRYPDARVLGVEPDPANAALARRNLAGVGERAHVIQAAAWDSDTELTVERSRREWELLVRPRRPEDPRSWPTVPGRTVNSLLEEFAGEEPIDFMYWEVEGSESRLLGLNTEWGERTRAITVELEVQYDGDVVGTRAALERLGFTNTRVVNDGALSFVTGLR